MSWCKLPGTYRETALLQLMDLDEREEGERAALARME